MMTTQSSIADGTRHETWETHLRQRNEALERFQNFKAERPLQISIKVLIGIVSALFVLGAVLPICLYGLNELLFRERLLSWSTLSDISSVFTAANVVVSTGALLAAIYAILLQNHELRGMVVVNELQAVELQSTAYAQKETAASHAAALSAEIILPLVDRIQESSQARKGIAFFLRHYLEQQLGDMPITEFHRQFQSGAIAPTDERWKRAVKHARSDFRRLREDSELKLKISRIGEVNYNTVQSWVSESSNVPFKLYGLWKAGVLQSDQTGQALAQIVLTPDLASLLHFQLREIVEEQRSERNGETDLPWFDFAVAIYQPDGLRQLAKTGTYSDAPEIIIRNTRL